MVSSAKWILYQLPVTACLALTCATNVLAAVNDILPADYFPLSKGTNTLAVYAYDRKASGYYVQGTKQADADLVTQILALRVGRFFEIAGKPVSVIVVLPWAKADIGPSALAAAFGKTASGMGDLRLGITEWVLSDRTSGQYLGVSAMASLPTGDYDRRQPLNIGENRYKATLSLGWIQPLGNSLNLELAPEIAWFGDNSDYVGGTRLKQNSAYALTGYLRYKAAQNWQFHAGGQVNYGGDTRINGIDQNNPPGNTILMLGTTFQSNDRKHQWIFRLAKNTEIKSGFNTDAELLIRYLRMY